ncbi:hypothetical protein LguiA_002422 [Lonicera macranthoides]
MKQNHHKKDQSLRTGPHLKFPVYIDAQIYIYLGAFRIWSPFKKKKKKKELVYCILQTFKDKDLP